MESSRQETKKESAKADAPLAARFSSDRVNRPVLLFDNTTTDSTSTTERLLTTNEVATLLNVSPQTVRRLQQQRKMHFHKVGGCIRYRWKDIEFFLSESKVETIK